jgi:hypothetical protein
MDCPECGKAIDDWAMTCAWCGHRIVPSWKQSPRAREVEPQIHALAIVSLVLAILGCCLGFMTAIPAVLLGHLAGILINRSNGRWTGRGLVITGLVLGYVVIVIHILPGVLIWPAIRDMPDKFDREVCRAQLAQIGLACRRYAYDNGGMYPDRWSRLCPKYVKGAEMFRCATDQIVILRAPGSEKNDNVEASYMLTPGRKPSDGAGVVLATEKSSTHEGKGRHVLYANGSVKWLPAKSSR